MSEAARNALAPVGETMFSPRAPFFIGRVSPPGAQVAACADEYRRGNLPVSPGTPSPGHAQKVGA
jgi:hypothetical protein